MTAYGLTQVLKFIGVPKQFVLNLRRNKTQFSRTILNVSDCEFLSTYNKLHQFANDQDDQLVVGWEEMSN